MGSVVVVDPLTRTDRDDGGDTGEEIGSNDGDDGASFIIDNDDRHEEEEDNDKDGGILDFIANVAIDAVECVGFEATRLTSDVEAEAYRERVRGMRRGRV